MTVGRPAVTACSDDSKAYSLMCINLLLVECRTLEGEPERSAYVCACRACKEQLHSHDCHQNVSGE